MDDHPRVTGKVLRWGARVVGTLMVALLLFFFIGDTLSGEGPFPIRGLPISERLELFATAVMALGAVLAWRWEFLGGSLCVIGGLGFNLVESLSEGRLRLVWFPVVFIVVGVIFGLCAMSFWQKPTRKEPPASSETYFQW
jgi:hypothetical protein